MGFFDDLANGISDLFFEARIEDGVRGTAQIVSTSGYYGHAIYQNCHLEVVVEAPGIPATATSLDALVHRNRWPHPGQVVPALIERADPREVQILWDEIPDSLTVAQSHAEAIAAAKRGEAPPPPEPGSLIDSPFGPGTTVKIVGDPSQITEEQRTKLRSIGIDIDALLGQSGHSTQSG